MVVAAIAAAAKCKMLKKFYWKKFAFVLFMFVCLLVVCGNINAIECLLLLSSYLSGVVVRMEITLCN